MLLMVLAPPHNATLPWEWSSVIAVKWWMTWGGDKSSVLQPCAKNRQFGARLITSSWVLVSLGSAMAYASFSLQMDGRLIVNDRVTVMLNAENVRTINGTSWNAVCLQSPSYIGALNSSCQIEVAPKVVHLTVYIYDPFSWQMCRIRTIYCWAQDNKQ